MRLSDKCKKRLNVLIPYYRKKYLADTNDGIWQQSWFYKDNTRLDICSCALEKGVVNQWMYIILMQVMVLIINYEKS